MRVLFVSSEMSPLAKTGGLADVGAALPAALARLGVDARAMLPAYPQALDAAAGKGPALDLGDVAGLGKTSLVPARAPDTGLPLWLVDCPARFRRAGRLYQGPDGEDWPDNAERFALFSQVAARIARLGGPGAWRPDVVHANDWHAGLVPLLLSAAPGPQPATLFTIHNVAYQGNFPAEVVPRLGLPAGSFTPEGVEFYGRLSFLKAGIRYANKLTTVSPTHAREILTPDYGFGLDGLLRHRARDLVGILNGVDYGSWDPVGDLHLPCGYSARDISGKRACKLCLQEEAGLPVNAEVPLVAFMSRLAHQKMADVVLEAASALAATGAQIVVLGDGDRGHEQAFRTLAEAHPGRIAVRLGYQEPAAHRLLAGADILLAPARFEPCGLGPLYALRYATLPVVRGVGGLSDTILDADAQSLRSGTGNGFVFAEPSAAAMIAAVDRALALYRQPVLWRKLQLHAMEQEFGWEASARRYLELYDQLAAGAAVTVLKREQLARAAGWVTAAASGEW